MDAAVQNGQLDLVRTDSLRRLLGTWHTELAAVRLQGEQERAHDEGVWVTLLRAETELGQISNRAATIPGSGGPYQGAPMPVPAAARLARLGAELLWAGTMAFPLGVTVSLLRYKLWDALTAERPATW